MLRGRIDDADRTLLRGWALDTRHPTRPATLLVTLNGALLGRLVANRFRSDLRDAGIGNGRHGFELRFEHPLSPLAPHLLRITDELDGTELDRSPWLLEPAPTLDAPALERLSTLLLDGLDGSPDALDARLAFLLDRLDHLLALRARALDDPAIGWRAARDHLSPIATLPRPAPNLALMLDEVMPDAHRDAGSTAILSHADALGRLGYRVLFASAERSPAPALLDALRARGIAPCAPPFYASVEEVLSRHGSALSLAYLHRGTLACRYGRLVRHHAPRARLLLSVADLQHVRLGRQAAFERREDLHRAAAQARAQELDAMVQCDAVLTHSTTEAALIAAVLPAKPVHRALWTIPARPVATPFADRAGVAFLADYAHAPNLDAARRLLREIMPLVWEHEPTLPCLLAGSRLPPNLAPADDPRVIPVGHVPELPALFERVRLCAAPLAYGAGAKGKLLQSLAAGIPCACSPIAAEGLDLPPPLDELVAADTHGLARLILRLHRDPALNARLSAAALSWAREALAEAPLDAALAAAIDPAPPSRARTTTPAGGLAS